MATGFIELDDTADPDIETLADTPCGLCGAPLDCGEYVTRSRPLWPDDWRSHGTGIRYLHPNCNAKDRLDDWLS